MKTLTENLAALTAALITLDGIIEARVRATGAYTFDRAWCMATAERGNVLGEIRQIAEGLADGRNTGRELGPAYTLPAAL